MDHTHASYKSTQDDGWHLCLEHLEAVVAWKLCLEGILPHTQAGPSEVWRAHAWVGPHGRVSIDCYRGAPDWLQTCTDMGLRLHLYVTVVLHCKHQSTSSRPALAGSSKVGSLGWPLLMAMSLHGWMAWTWMSNYTSDIHLVPHACKFLITKKYAVFRITCKCWCTTGVGGVWNADNVM